MLYSYPGKRLNPEILTLTLKNRHYPGNININQCRSYLSFISDPTGKRVLSALLINVLCFIMFFESILLSYCYIKTVATWKQ